MQKVIIKNSFEHRVFSSEKNSFVLAKHFRIFYKVENLLTEKIIL